MWYMYVFIALAVWALARSARRGISGRGLASAAAFFIGVTGVLITGLFVACDNSGRSEKWRTGEELADIETAKWGEEISFVSEQKLHEGEDRLFYFKTADGVEFTVFGQRSFTAGGSTCDYSDDYIIQQFYHNQDKYFIRFADFEITCTDHYEKREAYSQYCDTYMCDISSFDELEIFLALAEGFSLEIKHPSSPVLDKPVRLVLTHAGWQICETYDEIAADEVKRAYVDVVNNCGLDESLPEGANAAGEKTTEEETK